MPAQLPSILKNYAMMVDGVNYAGKCDEVTLPTLTIKEEEYRAGGMDGVWPLDMGMEKMELKASFPEHSPALFRRFGLINGGSTQALFRGAQSDERIVRAYTVTANGRVSVIAPDAATPGGKNPVAITMSLVYYKLEIDGELLIEIDVLGMKRVIGGVDVLEQMRELIG